MIESPAVKIARRMPWADPQRMNFGALSIV